MLLTFFVCRVPLAEEAHYQIEYYVPQVEGITECENRCVTYLTQTKFATMVDPHDKIKALRQAAKNVLFAVSVEDVETVVDARIEDGRTNAAGRQTAIDDTAAYVEKRIDFDWYENIDDAVDYAHDRAALGDKS
jgi:hypothetical protein